MATKVLVIITEDKVYATYGKTICFMQHCADEMHRQDTIDKAKAVAFSYACTFGFVYVNTITFEEKKTEQDIFNYLENHKI